MKFILASTSAYRRQQIEKIGIDFDYLKPEIDEEAIKNKLLSENQTPQQIAERLSYAKGLSIADKLSKQEPWLVLSGDQVVSFNNQCLGKPRDLAGSMQQLMKLQGQTHELITCVSLFSNTGVQNYTQITKLKMHSLSPDEVHNYVIKDEPYDCAGSYKIELSGISLFESILSDDFSAIQGLPMLWLTKKLREYGYEFFKS
jgi:septum formation protein